MKKLEEAPKYLPTLKKDKILSGILRTVVPYQPIIEKDLYLRLLRAISGQQLSIKAAATIWSRFLDLFPGRYPEADMVNKMDAEKMRLAGLSYQKAGYMKNIAEFSVKNNMSYEYLEKLTDEEVIQYLTKIKGVGKWTVEMILMFAMGRENIFPVDDLGVVTAIKKLYSLEEKGKDLKLRCTEIAEAWKPYRSYACFYLWPWRGESLKLKAES